MRWLDSSKCQIEGEQLDHQVSIAIVSMDMGWHVTINCEITKMFRADSSMQLNCDRIHYSGCVA